jgi:hypothetical protein
MVLERSELPDAVAALEARRSELLSAETGLQQWSAALQLAAGRVTELAALAAQHKVVGWLVGWLVGGNETGSMLADRWAHRRIGHASYRWAHVHVLVPNWDHTHTRTQAYRLPQWCACLVVYREAMESVGVAV